MLLSPSCAFNRSTTEVWLEQVNEIYPCRRPQLVIASTQPRQQSIGRLRAIQGQSPLECLREQYLNLKQALASLSRRVAYAYGALALANI
ncbi:MAG TPA: hypothetical protein V6C97_33680 [Oculatellaceae cyanobacterium]